MVKKTLFLLIISTFLLTGCTNKDSNTDSTNNTTTLSTSYKESTNTDTKLTLSGKTSTYTKYIYLGNLLFFPNASNNNKLSVLDISKTTNKITNDLVIDDFDYSVDSIATDNNFIYFSSLSNSKGLYKLDYQKKNITKISDSYPKGLVYQNGKLYYTDLNTQNIYSLDIKSNSKTLLSNTKVGEFIVNNNSIYYKNLDDSSKLYCLKIDSGANFKLTDTPVDSFITYSNKILFINTSDNNSLYSLDSSTKEIKKALNINATKLKQFDDKIYFINNNDPNSIYELKTIDQDNNFNYNKVFSDFTNEYFPTDKGIFIETSSNTNEIEILNIN
ncbi:DUF5050 domain-containing protein [Clostridium tertium]|jgi:hypothetical protein|uniref:DUF5050 domain-containing protein n=1 Tax=Clostridium TaxID=1485 RepID=UPI0018AAB6F4|nr:MULTISPECIES: DUF5050 domain-containing protein [Clostridium]MBS5308680.1 DUF5050 domain-containing protein [Clostridium sp.]MDB1924504.1 DUF5050 domain-containing protein [Clostridium tertium]MDB1928004.1 DUF5050 domain-containing protein [Clostridium tertium]MDB1931623.1 DUF5050 domain-containing protein [Clostridium tertium]MDB1934316.1 DUF5050 domain-containing protein [Clostridium tertium]